MYPFTYYRPDSLGDAVSALGEPGSKLLAGGQSLLPAMKQRLAMHEQLVDISPLEELHSMTTSGRTIEIGGGVIDARVAASSELQSAVPALSYLAAHIGAIVRTWHPQLRALFARADAESIAMLPVRSATPAIAHWQPGPVTLLGDAIHAMSPAAGAGANTALRDAAALAHACRPASLREGVARYERAMRDWAASAILASESGTRLLSGNTTLYH